jgi:hypothetical protein
MEPLQAASQAVPLIERGGVVASVVICAVLVVSGVLAALYVVWKRSEAAIAHNQKREEEHNRTIIDMALKNSELNHRLADTLESHTKAIESINETMQSMRTTLAVVAERVGHA